MQCVILCGEADALEAWEGFDPLRASYEWDEEKERINFAKHGIRFRTAARVFLDPDRLIREDAEHPGERRYDVLGRVGRVLFVVCTLRSGNTVRLISARIATSREKARYEDGQDEWE